jgi:hypothetical protein
MTPERRAEIEAMLDAPHAMFFYGDEDWQDPRFMDDANPIIRELLAEIDRLNSERTSMIEHHAFRWLDRAQHDPTQPEDDEQHEPVEQAVPPPGMV